MKLRFPARTTLGFPLTGARTYPTDAASARSATRADAAGETVLRSTRTEPGRAAAMTAVATASKASSSASDVRITSTCSTSSAGEAASDRTASRERLGLLRRAIAHDERVTGIEKALCERRAHVSETDQPHGETWVLGGTHCPV